MAYVTFAKDGFVYTVSGENSVWFGNGSCFENCLNVFPNRFNPSLTNLIIPSNVSDDNGNLYRVTVVLNNILCFSSDLESVFVPNTVRWIGNGAFYHCTNLKEVIFENNSELREIRYISFGECPKIEKLIIPPSVTKIGEDAFSNFSSLSILLYCGNSVFLQKDIIYPKDVDNTSLRVFVVHGRYKSNYFGKMKVISTSECLNDPQIKALYPTYKKCIHHHFFCLFYIFIKDI